MKPGSEKFSAFSNKLSDKVISATFRERVERAGARQQSRKKRGPSERDERKIEKELTRPSGLSRRRSRVRAPSAPPFSLSPAR